MREWCDLHGEPPMTRKQFEEEEHAERKYRRMNFRLSLSADELDWLLETLSDVARRFRTANQPSNALDVESSIRMWREEAADQGYRDYAALAPKEKP